MHTLCMCLQVLHSIFHVAEDEVVSAAVVEHQEHHDRHKAKRHELLARIPCVGGLLRRMEEVKMDTLTLTLALTLALTQTLVLPLSLALAPAPAPALALALALMSTGGDVGGRHQQERPGQLS